MGKKPRQSMFETDEDSLLPQNRFEEDEIEEKEEIEIPTIEVSTSNFNNDNHKNSNYNNEENYKLEVQNFVQAKEKKVPPNVLKIAFFIISWYTLSICLSIFNKWFFGLILLFFYYYFLIFIMK